MINLIIYLIYRIYSKLSLIISPKIGYWIAKVVGGAVYFLMREDRQERIKVIERISKGEITHKQARRAIRASFESFNKDLVDFFRIPKLNEDYLNNSVEFVGLENLDSLLKEGRGVILAGLHMGNGGFSSTLLALKGYPMNIVVWKERNKQVNRLFQGLRQNKGIRIIYSYHAARPILEALKQNEIVAMTIDLNGGKNGVKLNCCGKKISILRGIFVLAQKEGIPILPGVIIRKINNTHKIIIGRPLKIGLRQNEERNFEEDALKLFDFFKEYIEKYPEQWFWLRSLWQD